MVKLSRLYPSLFLFFLTQAVAGCSPPASPVLEVDVFGLPRDAARLDVAVTWNGSTGSAAFYRDGMNNYTTVVMQPSPMDSPPQASVALDLHGEDFFSATGQRFIRAACCSGGAASPV